VAVQSKEDKICFKHIFETDSLTDAKEECGEVAIEEGRIAKVWDQKALEPVYVYDPIAVNKAIDESEAEEELPPKKKRKSNA
jgi:hypothetical protein